LQVIAIDLVLAGDNAVVMGLAAVGLDASKRPKDHRSRHSCGTGATHLFASVAVYLSAMVGLRLAGELLLLWVCWKMGRELRACHSAEEIADAPNAPRKTFFKLADVSMSRDNVLAVAGAIREHPSVLAIRLVFSIALMGLAANAIAGLLNRHRWIKYVGLVIILYV